MPLVPPLGLAPILTVGAGLACGLILVFIGPEIAVGASPSTVVIICVVSTVGPSKIVSIRTRASSCVVRFGYASITRFQVFSVLMSFNSLSANVRPL